MDTNILVMNKDLLWLHRVWPRYRKMQKNKTWARSLWLKMLFRCACNQFSLSELLVASGALTAYG